MNLKMLVSAFAILAVAACGDAAVDPTVAPATTLAPTTTAPTTTATPPPATTLAPPTAPPTTTPPTTLAPTTTAPTTTAPPAACSAAGLPAAVPEQELPQPVAATRRRVVELAVACDYDGLAALAADAPFFTFSFGGGGDAAAFWREAEAQGDPVTRRMVEVFGLPFAVHADLDPPIYAWPELATLVDPTDADYDQVRGIYDEEAIELFKQFGGYIGYRAGIQVDGAWLSFVAGD